MKPEVKQKATSIEDIRSIVGHELKTGKEGVKQIADALRLLEGAGLDSFRWDYRFAGEQTECGAFGCAIGWTQFMWPDQIDSALWEVHDEDVTDALGLPNGTLDQAFFGVGDLSKRELVRPHHVADELDRIAETL